MRTRFPFCHSDPAKRGEDLTVAIESLRATTTHGLQLSGPFAICAAQDDNALPFGDRTMIELTNKKIAVLKGGPGSERDVSLATGTGVGKALRSLGAIVTEVDVEDADFALPNDIELAFIALHGTFGEDGQVQQILEDRGVPYTGEGVAESRLAFDKIPSKEKFTTHGVATPHWEIIASRPATFIAAAAT